MLTEEAQPVMIQTAVSLQRPSSASLMFPVQQDTSSRRRSSAAPPAPPAEQPLLHRMWRPPVGRVLLIKTRLLRVLSVGGEAEMTGSDLSALMNTSHILILKLDSLITKWRSPAPPDIQPTPTCDRV